VNYIIKGKKYIFALLVLIVLSACSTTPPQPKEAFEPSHLATVSISNTESQANLEATYGAKALVFRPEAGFAILGFDDQPQLSTLATEPNASVASPEVSAQGSNAWGGGSNSWASGVNSWGSGTNAWGSGTNAWGSGSNAWGGGTNAWGSGVNAWGSGSNAWGSGNTTIPSLPSENRFMLQQIRLPQAHTVSRNFGAGVKIAVIDTGIDLNHPLFTGRLAPSTEWKDFVGNDAVPQEVAGSFYGHGTGIAGLIAQTAPRATILPIRVLGPDGVGDVAKIVMAIDWAVQKGANVINLSLGTNEHVASFEQAVVYAAQMGVYVVAAAGNEGNVNGLLYPAEYMTTSVYNAKMFSVGSFSAALSLSLFSNSGPELEYVAPGEFLTSAYPDLRVAQYTGSSFATPIVAGAVALAQGDAATANKKSIETYLYNGSVNFGANLGRQIDVTNLLRNVPGFVTRKALLVTGSTTLNTADSQVKTRLEGMGYSVTLKTHSSVLASDATGKDVVYISRSVDSSMQAKLRDVTTPVVVAKDQIFDDMKMTTLAPINYGATTLQSSVQIRSTHPMASGFSTAIATLVYASGNDASWGVISSSGTIVATLAGNTTKATLFAYNKGASMEGLTAPARRVGGFFNSSGSVLNTFGWQLFESAITWATSGN
jgi:thermitase